MGENNKLTDTGKADRLELFIQFMLECTDENHCYTKSGLKTEFNNWLGVLRSDLQIRNDTVIDTCLYEMRHRKYTIIEVPGRYVEYYCKNVKIGNKKKTKEDFARFAKTMISIKNLSIEDVNSILQDNFEACDPMLQTEIMSYFGITQKIEFAIENFFQSIRNKFTKTKKPDIHLSEQSKLNIDIIRKANNEDQQIAFHYKRYNPNTKRYEDVLQNGVLKVYRYNAYGVFKFGERFYVYGRDIANGNMLRIYRVDLMKDIDYRKNYRNEYGDFTLYKEEGFQNDQYALMINLLKMYMGVKRKVIISVEKTHTSRVVSLLARNVNYLGRKSGYDLVSCKVTINETFIYFLQLNPEIVQIEVNRNIFVNNENGRIKLKNIFITRRLKDLKIDNLLL